MRDQIAFIGDVHGRLAPLAKVVERVRYEAASVVFLGDYINRGSESSQVLEYLVEVQRDLGCRAHFLLGHHDEAFLAAIEDGRIDRFLRMGGAATLSSYPGAARGDGALSLSERVPTTHIEFLRNLDKSFIAPGCFAAHDPSDGEALPADTFGVFGHRVLPAGVPEISASRALIDTGCGTISSGKLTCFLWPELTWFQAS